MPITQAASSVVTGSQTEQVDAFMKKLKHPMKKVAEALRAIIMDTDNSIGEEIAWNAPSFYFRGKMKPFNPKEYKRFIAGMNFFKKDSLRLIFLHGARLDDRSGLLEGDYADGRRLAFFSSVEDVKAKEKTIRKLVKKWLQTLEK